MDAATHDHTYTDDEAVPDDELPDEYQHHSDAKYVKIAVILALITALEVATYYVDFGVLFLPTLFALMIIKFFMVAWFFMHLKDDAKIFGRVFWSGLFLAIAVYVGALSAFQMFSS